MTCTQKLLIVTDKFVLFDLVLKPVTTRSKKLRHNSTFRTAPDGLSVHRHPVQADFARLPPLAQTGDAEDVIAIGQDGKLAITHLCLFHDCVHADRALLVLAQLGADGRDGYGAAALLAVALLLFDIVRVERQMAAGLALEAVQVRALRSTVAAGSSSGVVAQAPLHCNRESWRSGATAPVT